MNVTLNNYTDEQYEFVRNSFKDDNRIIIHRHLNEKKSNEKLRYIGTGRNPFVGFFDNDIKYPSDYLQKMIKASINYNAYVSLHGCILAPRPVRSYYADRFVYRGLATVINDYEVDIASNCGSVFQRQFFPEGELAMWYDRCNDVSADDIYTNYWARKHNVIRMVIKHSEGYIIHKQQLPDEEYVFDKHTKQLGVSDKPQTDFINNYWK
jgi:hypothetical protein